MNDQIVPAPLVGTHVIAIETIAIPQAKRDAATVDAIFADLLARYPANFSLV